MSRRSEIDLGVETALVTGNPADIDESALTQRIQSVMARNGANVGIGRYREARLLYSSPLFAPQDDPDGERRTVHLGIDLFAPAGTRSAPRSTARYTSSLTTRQPLDYGPLVILRHVTDAGHVFYTLYGHLSRASLDGLAQGQTIGAGGELARLGSPRRTADGRRTCTFNWSLDLLDLGGDFPGVCRPGDEDVWCSLSPDPELILRLGVGAGRGRYAFAHRGASLARSGAT